MDSRMTKRKTRARFLLIALAVNLALAGVLNVHAAHACTCINIPGAEEGLRTSDAVFAGEATDIEADYLAPGNGPPLGRVVFDVTESWKGVPEEPVVAYGQGPGASCGLDFDEGKSYLVYAYRTGDGPDDHLETNLCTATKPLSEARDDLRVLGSPPDALPDTGGSAISPLDRGTTGIMAAILALLTLVGVLLVRAKRGRV